MCLYESNKGDSDSCPMLMVIKSIDAKRKLLILEQPMKGRCGLTWFVGAEAGRGSFGFTFVTVDRPTREVLHRVTSVRNSHMMNVWCRSKMLTTVTSSARQRWSSAAIAAIGSSWRSDSEIGRKHTDFSDHWSMFVGLTLVLFEGQFNNRFSYDLLWIYWLATQ